MFVQSVALPPIPNYARVTPEVVSHVLKRMLGDADSLVGVLDDAFHAMERRQPWLAQFVADELAEIEAPQAQGLAYFLVNVVYLAFEEAFGGRLSVVQSCDLAHTARTLITDGELRGDGAVGVSYSEDAIAVGQPALIALLRSEVDRAIEADPQDAGWQRVDALYELALVELLALTACVAP